jgi:hypothetical protein
MTDPNAFAKMVPGFDFLQGLMKNAGGSVPAMSQWIAPTLDPDELDKRIGDLRTVQFWLEQNAKLIAASIQALEVQRMTLVTLKTMNLPMSGLHEAMTLTPPAPPPAPAAAPKPAPEAPPAPAAAPAGRADAEPAGPARSGSPRAVDPMQWWGALTQQFGELAARALQDMPGVATGSAAKAAGQPAGKVAARTAARTAAKTATKAAAKAAGTAAPARKRPPAPKRAGGR